MIEKRRAEYLAVVCAALVLAGQPAFASGSGKSISTSKQQSAAVKMIPSDLRVEYAKQPIGIDVLHPRLTWKIPSTGDGRQSAYQIRVATSASGFERAALWDSGRVKSAESVQLPYAGPALTSRTRYWWQVRTWDGKGQASEWSEASFWEMGLLAKSDWSAQWIGGRQTVDHDWRDAIISIDFTLTGKSVGFLFRAKPVGKTYGEAYLWEVGMSGGKPKLLAKQRHYAGGSSSAVTTKTLKTVALADAAANWKTKRHNLTIETKGTSIITRLDGVVIDTLVDDGQSAGTIGMTSEEVDAAVIHSVRVEDQGKELFRTDFSDGISPFTGGHITEKGLAVAAGVPDKDLVLPLSAPAPLLRHQFNVAESPVSARLYLAAGGLPKLTLNQNTVGDALQDGYTAYDKRVLYRTFDVTNLIKIGANVLGVELGRGWYGVTEPNEWYWHMAPWHAAPTVLAQLELSYADGRRVVINSDGSWRTTDGPTQHDSVYGGERYDARLLPAGWLNAGFEDSAWSKVAVVNGPAGVLSAAQQEPITNVGVMTPVAVTEPKPGIYVFDFGRIFAGRLHLNVKGPRGTTVRLIQTEKLAEDGGVEIVSGLVDTQLQTDQYTLAGGGAEQWMPSFSYKGFRYVQVEGFPGTPSLDALTGEIVHSAVAMAGEFESSNELLNKIQAAARNTILNNMHGNQTDTPTLEKNGWTGDAQASALASITNFKVAGVWTKWLADFRDSQSAKGEIPKIVPSTPYYGYEESPGWEMVWGAVPPWDAATFILPWEMYQALGDRRILEQMYVTQKNLVDYTGGFFTEDNYSYNNPNNPFLGEYSVPLPPGGFMEAIMRMPAGPVDATAAAYYFHMINLLAQSADILGKTKDRDQYRALANKVRTAYNQRYWDAKKEIYRALEPSGQERAYAQTPNILPVAFGMVPTGHEAAVVRHLNADIVAQNNHLMTTGVYAGRYVMTMLGDYGYADTAYALATQTDLPSWGYWINNGLSTMAEGWELTSRSYDHHYWGSISSYFYQSIAGIRASAPGYRSIVIKPYPPTGLEWARASIDTERGVVESSWKRADGRFTLKVRVPAAAEIWVPTGGVKAASVPTGARFKKIDGAYAIYQIGAGSFNFEAKDVKAKTATH
ncbi:family 78 glycoside hydrolase catalytic domain [Stenotrophobium rhamnosiphilum]|nr:family 78 glycoside hydrolase catalytic domain [Stenotrophobium rhamnosiphilum]